MKFELFIARKLFSKQQGEKQVSLPAVRIATMGIALGVAVMILSVAIVLGFKNEIKTKVIGFGSHIQISSLNNSSNLESNPIIADSTLMATLLSDPEISHAERFASKPGIIKSQEEFQGVILKGVGTDFDWSFIEQHLVEGNTLNTQSDTTVSNTDVLISQAIANQLKLKTGQSFMAYFVQEQLRMRKYNVRGIYKTDLAELDKMIVYADIKQVQRLNQWREDQVSGVEITIKNFDNLEQTTDRLFYQMQKSPDADGNDYYVRSIIELNPQIFSWLDLLDINVWMILTLMLLVAGFTMISGLLIIILERTNMIGILKAQGANNRSIRKIFLYLSAMLISRGLLWGNILGITLALIQLIFKPLSLDPEMYYLSKVPIELNIIHLILLNLGTLGITLLMLIAPSMIIAKIAPAKSIRFE
ncbi:MAG: ABC transporter permease [Bacteroidales bacterium]